MEIWVLFPNLGAYCPSLFLYSIELCIAIGSGPVHNLAADSSLSYHYDTNLINGIVVNLFGNIVIYKKKIICTIAIYIVTKPNSSSPNCSWQSGIESLTGNLAKSLTPRSPPGSAKTTESDRWTAQSNSPLREAWAFNTKQLNNFKNYDENSSQK